jgi:cytoskeletal protein RodZ
LTVIITCTWLAIHPNVPSPKDGFWYRKVRHLGLTVIGLIAPEIILIWAALQNYSARKIRDELRKQTGPPADNVGEVSQSPSNPVEESQTPETVGQPTSSSSSQEVDRTDATTSASNSASDNPEKVPALSVVEASASLPEPKKTETFRMSVTSFIIL